MFQLSPHHDAHGAAPDPGEDASGARRRRLVTLLGTDPTATPVTADTAGPPRDPVPDPGPGPGPGMDRPPETSDGVDGARPVHGLRDRLDRLCAVTVSELGVSGAGVTVMGGTDGGRAGRRDQLAGTGALTRRLEDLQLTTGEGPCLDAFDAGAPVLAGDLAAETRRWLGFGPEALAAGAAAVFSLPLQLGAVRLGTLDLHRTTSGALGREQLADALMLAGLATETLLELVGDHRPAPDDPTSGAPNPEPDDILDASTAGLLSETAGWLPDVHADVHVASGMVAARDSIDVGAALLRIRAHAFAAGEPIGEVARRIIDRDLVLDHPGTGHADPPDDGPAGPHTDSDPENDQ